MMVTSATAASRRVRRALGMGGFVVTFGAAVAVAILVLGRAESAPAAPADKDKGPPPSASTPSAAPGATNAPQVEVQNEGPTTSPNVKIVFRTLPSNITVNIKWGGKKFGIIKPKTSLTVERPRDSGPLDLVFSSQGYINVHTRAYTFTNSVVIVKMTPVDKKNTIYGYKEEIPPETDGGAPGEADAGTTATP